MEKVASRDQLLLELEELRTRLYEAEETLRAIRAHEVDALLIDAAEGQQQVFTLKGAEQPYRIFMEEMNEGAATVTPDGTVLYCNGRLAEMLKTPLNKIMGSSLAGFVIPEKGQPLLAMLEACGVEGCRGELLLRASEGGELAVSFAARPLMLDDVAAFGLVLTDLTYQKEEQRKLQTEVKERKKAQKGLEKAQKELEQRVARRTAALSRLNATLQAEIDERKKAEERARHLASFPQQNPDPILEISSSGEVTFFNTAAQRILEDLGADRGDFKGLLPEDLDAILRGRDKTNVATLYREVTLADRVFGETMYLIPEFNVVRIYARDITERKRAEEALRQSERLYRAIGESIDYGVWVCAPDGRNMYSSESFLKMVGLTQEQCSNFGWGDVLHPDDAERTIAAWKECVQTGGIWDIEHRFRGVDGQWHHVLARGIPVRDEQGRITHWAGINLDISSLKQAQLSLQKARAELELRVEERTAELQKAYETLKAETKERERLEEQLRQAQKMQAIGTLAGGIAHDFNNILAAIIGFTQMVLDDVADNAQVQHKMERVLQAGLRGRDLVRQILAFSRKTEGEQKEISLTSLVKETHALLRSSLPTTIQMNLAITTNDDHVLADPTQLQQVLMNLATNAAYAMRDDGGLLTIGLSSVTFPQGSLLPDPEMEPGTYVQLTVKDTGTGMTDEVRQRIFEPFFTTKEPGQGTGMGLAVVYGIVKAHGGALTVQSELGQGSTFEVFLPRAEKPEARKEEATTSVLPTGTERILFVDDEEMLVEMARGMLQSLGYQVTVAQHGSEAWNLFLADPSRFDLVITDQTMPDVTGVTLAQKMLRVRKEMPIVLCTGYSERVSAETARDVGICEFVMKPVVKKELAEILRRVLDGRKG